MGNNKKQLIELYRDAGWKRFFAPIRFWDAPLEEVEKLVPRRGIVVELGSGDGILSNYIALSSEKREVIGIEIDRNRAKTAKRGVKNVKFLVGDITTISIPKSDSIIIAHVLHHLNSYEDQEKVLIKAISCMKENGSLIILEIYQTFHIKYFLGWFIDHFLVPIFFESRIYSPIYFRKKEEWISLLKKLNMKVEAREYLDGQPIANIILTAKKA